MRGNRTGRVLAPVASRSKHTVPVRLPLVKTGGCRQGGRNPLSLPEKGTCVYFRTPHHEARRANIISYMRKKSNNKSLEHSNYQQDDWRKRGETTVPPDTPCLWTWQNIAMKAMTHRDVLSRASRCFITCIAMFKALHRDGWLDV